MRTWTVRIRKVDKEIFERIRTGQKTIETRALNSPDSYRAYYGKIQAGDKIVFLCNGERVTKTVKSIRYYRNFDKYLATEDLENIFGKGTTIDKAKEIHYGFPGYRELLEKYGIVAFDIE